MSDYNNVPAYWYTQAIITKMASLRDTM